MEVFEAVRTILAVREYQDKPIPADTMRRIVEAAHLSASSMNRQPWHFIAVDDGETLRQLGSVAQTGPYIAQAPFAVVVCIEDTRFSVSDSTTSVCTTPFIVSAQRWSITLTISSSTFLPSGAFLAFLLSSTW